MDFVFSILVIFLWRTHKLLFSTFLIFILNKIRTPFLSLSQGLRQELACRVFFVIGIPCSQIYHICYEAVELILRLRKSPLSWISIGAEALRRWDFSRAHLADEKANNSLLSVITGLMP